MCAAEAQPAGCSFDPAFVLFATSAFIRYTEVTAVTAAAWLQPKQSAAPPWVSLSAALQVCILEHRLPTQSCLHGNTACLHRDSPIDSRNSCTSDPRCPAAAGAAALEWPSRPARAAKAFRRGTLLLRSPPRARMAACFVCMLAACPALRAAAGPSSWRNGKRDGNLAHTHTKKPAPPAPCPTC